MSELRRPAEGRVIAGVCAGLADRWGVSRTLIRVLAVLSILLPGPQVIIYLVLWAVIPGEARGSADQSQPRPLNAK